MNKKVLVSAIGAALMAGAMAANAEVTVYGKVHVSADYVDLDTTASERFGVSSNASRLGFKGSEDLGGGLKGVFQLESGIDATNDGQGGLTSRNRFVGLSGGFGTLLAGVYDAPIKSIGRSIELFPEYVGDARNITAVGLTEARHANSITYTAPKLGPIALQAQYSADRGTTAGLDNQDDADVWGASAVASLGVVRLGAAYQSANTTGADNENALRVIADAKFGAIRVVGLWQQSEDVSGVANTDQDAFGVGAAFTMGNNVLKAQWYTLDDADNTASSGADMWVVGWDYKFSKKVTGYVAYSQVDNDANATRSTSFNNGWHGDNYTGTGNATPSAFSVGMIMDF